jgi:hypothetical protein
MGQIKKENTIFDNLRMSKRGPGQERYAPPCGGAMMHLQVLFYDGWSRLNNRVKPFFLVRKIPDSNGEAHFPLPALVLHP